MRTDVKLGRVFGIELGLHFSWILIAGLITVSLAAHFHRVNTEWGETTIWSAAVLTGLLFFAGLIAHELSHALVAQARGLRIRGITLFALGGVAQMEQEPRNANTEFLMAIAGPATSAAVGILCLGIALALGWRSGTTPQAPGTAIAVWLGYINLALAAFNMLPGFPLDGGRVLRAVVWWITRNRDRATRIAARVGQVVAALFIGYGVFEFFAGAGFSGLWLALIGWFLLQSAGASYQQVRAVSTLRGLTADELMSRDCPSIESDLDLLTFVNSYLLRTGQRCFVVVEAGRFVGLLTAHEVRNLDRGRWPEMTVRDAMRPLARIRVIPPQTPITEALEVMSRENVNQLPVVQDGRLLGVLSRRHILQVLQARSELAA